jgi:hypothetical protein
VRGGEVWRLDPVGRRIDAVVARSADGRQVDIGGAASPGAALQWRAPAGEWVVYTAESRGNGEQVKRPAPGGAGSAVDVLSRAAVDDYLRRFGERAMLPNGTVRAYFHDSYEYTGTGSAELFRHFRERRGYDLAHHLPALLGVGPADSVARVKADYRRTMHEMLLDHLVSPLRRWAHARGSLTRNQAHGSPGNLLDLYAASDIPETEIFGPLGTGDNDPLVSKFASSAAHLAGRRLTSAEAVTWLGEHFTVTLDQIRRALDQLFVSGINHVVYHGTAYSPREAEWPGWLFYASTQVNLRNAIWRDLPALNAYVTRVQSELQSGEPDGEVLLYWPIHDSWHDPEGLRMDFRVHSPRWLHGMPVGGAAGELWRRGVGFDYLSDQLLADRATARGGRVAAGEAEYRAIVVPRAEHVPEPTLSRLLELARQGATIAFVGDLPPDVPGLHDVEERRARRAAQLQSLRLGAADAQGVRAAAVGAGRVLVAERLEPLLAAAGVRRERMVDAGGLQFIRRRHPWGWSYFVRNAGEESLEGWVPLAVPAAAAGIMDPLTGRTGMAEVRGGGAGETEVRLQLEPGESRVLRAFRGPATGQPWSYLRSAGEPRALSGRWEVEFVDGGPTLPRPYRAESLASWTEGADPELQRFAGTARYTLRFDAPGQAPGYLIDLGRVAESARVRVNGEDLGTLLSPPFRVRTGPLRHTGNVLEVEVTNLSANRIRDLDLRGVPWKTFHDINFVGIDYKSFDASGWPVRPSGLLGPVRIQPLARP